MKLNRNTSILTAVVALLLMVTSNANAVLVSQFGVLDLSANGGINPNTGLAWAAGDQYRLAFFTAQGISGVSNNPAVYDAFATAQAQQNPALATSTGWTALVWVNTDSSQAQGAALSDPTVRAGINNFAGGAGVGGAGVPVYAMDGTTAIARNNADIDNSWSNPFEDFVAGAIVANAAGTGGNTVRRIIGGTYQSGTDDVHYSPFLNQFGLGDSGVVHGPNIWTGGIFDSHINALGNTIDNTTGSRGNANANNTGRIWNRFTDATTTVQGVYAISGPLTVREAAANAIPEPATASLALLGLGGLMMRRRRATV